MLAPSTAISSRVSVFDAALSSCPKREAVKVSKKAMKFFEFIRETEMDLVASFGKSKGCKMKKM